MKKMKTFKKFVIDEATFQTTLATLDQDIPTGDYSDPKVVRALNSFVGTVARATKDGSMIPEMVVSRMRSSLSKIGLTVRINDKIQRLINLVVKNNRKAQNEPTIDAFKDLACYGIIAQIVKNGKWGK